jgi:Protein of unknown function (DUF2860)
MKKDFLINSLIAALFMFFTVFFIYAYSYADDLLEDGFSGVIAIGIATETGEKGLGNVDNEDDRRLTSLTQDCNSDSSAMPFIAGEIRYTFGETGTSVALGTMGEVAALSVSQYLGDIGIINISAGLSKEEVYSDPYLTGVRRHKTDKTSSIFTFFHEDILKSGIMAGYTLELVDVDNDFAGKRHSDLYREGKVHTFFIGSDLFEKMEHSVSAGIAYSNADMDGESNSYDAGSAEVTYTYARERWEIETSISGTIREYEKRHPNFNKAREENEFALSCSYTINRPFNWENHFVTCFVSGEVNDSNIDFFDSHSVSTGFALGCEF